MVASEVKICDLTVLTSAFSGVLTKAGACTPKYLTSVLYSYNPPQQEVLKLIPLTDQLFYL